MKKKSKSKVYKQNLVLVVIGIIVIFISAYNIVNLALIEENKKVKLDTLKSESYVIGKEPTALQKDIFKKLIQAEKEEDKNFDNIAKLVGEAFVIDFFTWTNKDSSFDVGGLQYFYDANSFSKTAHWEYYQKLDVFNSTYKKDNLPQVASVNAIVQNKDSYLLNEKIYDSYTVDVSWTYESEVSLNKNELIDNCEVVLIKDKNKLKIVEVNMIEEVEENEI